MSAEESHACMVVWGVVNVVCLLQAIGFATRPFAPGANPILGVGIVAAAIPATYAIVVFWRARSGWLLLLGPLVFDAFVALHVVVDWILDVEWRDPPMPLVQIPYLVLFFGSIALMGMPMYRLDRRRWVATVVSAALLIAAMLYAISRGVG